MPEGMSSLSREETVQVGNILEKRPRRRNVQIHMQHYKSLHLVNTQTDTQTHRQIAFDCSAKNSTSTQNSEDTNAPRILENVRTVKHQYLEVPASDV